MIDMDTGQAATCDETALLLSRGLEGDLSGAEACRLYRHVAECDACRLAMGEMAAVDMAVRELKRHLDAVPLDDGFSVDLAKKLEAGDGNGNVVRQFVRRAAQEPALRHKLQAATDQAAFVTLCVRLGRESGFSFTAAQVESLLGVEAANESELSDEQLDRVAAGAGGFDGLKLLDFLNRP